MFPLNGMTSFFFGSKAMKSRSQEEIIDTIVMKIFSGIGHSFPNVLILRKVQSAFGRILS